MVDDEDFAYLSRFKWSANTRGAGANYAIRRAKRPDGSYATIYMHRAIMGAPPAPGMEVDHREPVATLDNRRSNLRWATRAQQCSNRRGCNSSGYKGVNWQARNHKWRAILKSKHLGLFDSPEEAHAAYCLAAKEQYKDFACTSHMDAKLKQQERPTMAKKPTKKDASRRRIAFTLRLNRATIEAADIAAERQGKPSSRTLMTELLEEYFAQTPKLSLRTGD